MCTGTWADSNCFLPKRLEESDLGKREPSKHNRTNIKVGNIMTEIRQEVRSRCHFTKNEQNFLVKTSTEKDQILETTEGNPKGYLSFRVGSEVREVPDRRRKERSLKKSLRGNERCRVRTSRRTSPHSTREWCFGTRTRRKTGFPSRTNRTPTVGRRTIPSPWDKILKSCES